MFRDGSLRWFEHEGQFYTAGVLTATNQVKLVSTSSIKPTDIPHLAKEVDDEILSSLLAGHSVSMTMDQIKHFAVELPTEDIRGVTIFVAGTWTDSGGRKQTYTEADLDEMVRNSLELQDKVKPHVKLMHLNPKDHLKVTAKPALGWVMNLRREGTKLVADFLKVPRQIAALIRAGTFRRTSSEIFRRFRDEATGKVYKNVVSAVGLLGAVHPAVSTIDDVMKLFGMKEEDGLKVESQSVEDWGECYGAGDAVAVGFYEAEYTEGDNNKLSEGGDNTMDEKELAKMKADILKEVKSDFEGQLETKIQEFQAPLRELLGLKEDGDVVAAVKAALTDKDSAVKELGDRETADFEAKVDEIITDAKKTGVIAPAQEHGIRLMIDGWSSQVDETGKFELKLDEKKSVTGTVLENLKAYFEAMPKKYNIGKERGGMSEPKAGTAALPMSVRRELGAQEVPARVVGNNYNEAVLSYKTENKCDFLTAFTAVTGVTPGKEPEVGDYSINDSTGELHRA